MKKSGWLLLLALICLGCKGKQDKAEAQLPIKAQTGTVSPTPTSNLPEGVLAWAAFGSPQKLIQNAEQMVSKTSPLPAGVLSGSLSQALIPFGLKDTRVIDLSSPAGVLMLNPTQYNPPLVVALTTTGEQAVLDSLKGNWTQGTKQDGIHQLSREVVNAQAVFQGAGDAKKTKQNLFVKFVGPTALAALSREALLKGGQVLFDQLKRSAPAQGLQAAIQLDNIRKSFQAQLAMAPMMLKAQATQQLKATMPEESSKLIVKIIEWYIDKMMALFNQTEQIGLALGVQQTGALLHFSLAPVKNSFFAKFLASQKKSSLDSVRYLPSDTAMAMAVNVQWDMLKADMITMTQELLSLFSKSSNQSAIMAMLSEWFDVVGDEVAVSQQMGPKGIEFLEVIDIKDEARAKSIMTKMMKLSHDLFGGLDLGGYRIKKIANKKLPKVAGKELNQAEVVLDYGSSTNPQVEMMKKLYGNKMNLTWSIFDKKLVFGMGANAVQDVKKLIDGSKDNAQGLIKSQRFQAAAGGLEKQAGGFMFISIVEFALGSLKSNPAMAPSLAKIKLPQSKSGIFLSFNQQDGQFVTSMRLPTDHLNEMGELFRSFSN